MDRFINKGDTVKKLLWYVQEISFCIVPYYEN